jgi:predicted GNAT family N-acyltransferase
MPAAIPLTLRIDAWSVLRDEAWAVRHEVFVLEQNVPLELEQDEMDEVSLHAVVQDGRGQPIGTGRLLPDGHIGRMAVLQGARGSGVGSAILTALMERARQRGDRTVLLNAQIHAQGFYARHGFVAEGAKFMEAGIPHVSMRHVFPTPWKNWAT